MGCRLQANILKKNCQYSLAGVKSLYIFNYDPAVKYTFADEDGTADTQGKQISKIELAEGDKAYKIDFVDGTASWADELAVGGNGGKYRTHTLNFTLSQYDYELLNQGDALSLGRFVAVVVDKSGRCVVLGRGNGLSATSFNYASGAADADANGWTTVMAGSETEIGKLLTDESVMATLSSTTTVAQ